MSTEDLIVKMVVSRAGDFWTGMASIVGARAMEVVELPLTASQVSPSSLVPSMMKMSRRENV